VCRVSGAADCSHEGEPCRQLPLVQLSGGHPDSWAMHAQTGGVSGWRLGLESRLSLRSGDSGSAKSLETRAVGSEW
jgi:hypothetical protein